MKKRYGRRGCDNGWKSKIRDYGVGALFLIGIFYAGFQYSFAQTTDAKAETNGQAIQELVKVQSQRAREMGRVNEALASLKEQSAAILKVMLEDRKETR